MKAIGLGAAGVGAAAASAPVFHDLDELSSSGGSSNNIAGIQGGAKLPWWIKKRDHYNPTVEVDWDLRKRLDFKHGGYAGGVAPLPGPSTNVDYTPEQEDELVRSRLIGIYNGIKNNMPGDSRRDYAMDSATGVCPSSPPLAGLDMASFSGTRGALIGNLNLGNKIITPAMAMSSLNAADLDLPRYEGTPEENLNMLRRMASFFGMPIVGALEMTPELKKIPYNTLQNRRIVWDDEIGETIEKPYRNDEITVLPRSLRWVAVAQIPQSGCSNKYGTTLLGGISSNLGYSDEPLGECRMSTFIASLGYNQAIGQFCSNPGLGILAGLGELGRHDYLVSPFFGSHVRFSIFIFTDLPLTPTPPIDAGIWKFCHTCKKCADTCPGESISKESKPTWDITGKWNGYGNNSWHIRYDRCLPWRGTPGGLHAGSCRNCMGTCVFSKKPFASIHEIIKMTSATTSAFNGFFRVMDDFFDYGRHFDPKDFWDISKMGNDPFNGYGACVQ